MKIAFPCGKCSQKLTAESKYAGRKVQCPKCGTVGIIPGQSATDEPHGVGRADGQAATGAGLRTEQGNPVSEPKSEPGAVCKCGQRVTIPAWLVGSSVTCPTCGAAVGAPTDEGPRKPGRGAPPPALEDRAVGSPESSEAGDEEAEGGAAGEKGSALAKTFTDWRYIALMVATLGAFISTIVMAAKQSPDAGVVAATGKAVLAAGIISLVILIPIFAACDFPWANRTVYNLMRGLGRCFKGFFISILAGVLSGSGAFGAAAGGYSMSQDRGDDDFYDADDCEPKVSALTALLVTSTLGSILASLLFWVIALGASPSLAAQGVGARPRSAQTQAAKPVEAFRDPVHGFFEVSLPSDCKMAKKGTDTTMKLTGPSPEAGKVVRCSRVSFGLGKGTIAVRARETFHGVVDDALMDEIMRRLESRVPSASVKDKRFMTCDEAKAAQLVATFQQFTNHTVRYKKHGLDHTINFTCPTSDYGLLRDPFLAFVGSYRSRDPRAEDAKGTPVAGEGEVETPGVAPDAPEPDVALELDLPAHHVLSRLPAGFGLRRSLSLPTSGGASSVCFSPNGRLLAAASGGDGPGAVRAWEASTGKEVYSIATDASSVHFSPDGRWLASSRADHVDVWDATTGKTVWSIDWPGEDVTCARFSPNGRWIAAAGTSVALWDVTTREKLRSFPNESVAAACLEFSPAGDMLAFPSGKLIRVFDAASGDERRTLKSQYTERVLSIAFSPDGKRLASTSHTAWNAMEIKLWDVTTGSEVSLSSGRRKESASSAAFSPDGRLLAVGGGRAEGRLLWVFDTVTSKILMKQAGTGGYTTAVCFNPAGSLIASSAREAETLLWAIEKTVRVPVRPTIPILQGKSRSRRIVTSSSTPCFSRVYWQVAGSDDQPSGDYFDGLANADSYCAALLARELLREYAYGMKAHSPYLQGAAAISEELGYRYGGLLKAVAQVRDKGRAALTEHRGLTFLAALSLLTTGDSDKVSAVTRVAPEYACLFVVECVARQWARPKRVLPSGVPPPLEKLDAVLTRWQRD